MKNDAYKDAGVDIEAGDRFVKLIKPYIEYTYRPEVMGTIGGFGGCFNLGKLIDKSSEDEDDYRL